MYHITSNIIHQAPKKKVAPKKKDDAPGKKADKGVWILPKSRVLLFALNLVACKYLGMQCILSQKVLLY